MPVSTYFDSRTNAPAHSCPVSHQISAIQTKANMPVATALPAAISWRSRATSSSEQTALANPALLSEELYRSVRMRSPHRYPKQRNYIGYYFFTGVGAHVWHESLVEASALRQLDFEEDIRAISAQPMVIRFADGSWHVPDYLALHANGTQVVYDVKPSSLMDDKVLEQFAKTRDVCEAVGWGYSICNDLSPLVNRNLRWLSNFKHPGYLPESIPAERIADVINAVSQPTTVGEAVRLLGAASAAHGRAAIYHLIWAGVLSIDLTQRINDRALIKGGRHAGA